VLVLRQVAEQVKKLIAGPGVYICDECIDLCNEIIEEELAIRRRFASTSCRVHARSTPSRRLRHRAGAGEEAARGGRLQPLQAHPGLTNGHMSADVELAKSKSSCSADRLRQDAAGADPGRMLNVPFASPTPPPSPRRLRGEDVENILLKLIQAADYDVKKAETGIIYIDEIDKIAARARTRRSRVTSRRGRAAGAAEDPGGHDGSVPPQGAASTPPGVHPDRHDEHLVHLRRGVRRLEKIIGGRLGNGASASAPTSAGPARRRWVRSSGRCSRKTS